MIKRLSVLGLILVLTACSSSPSDRLIEESVMHEKTISGLVRVTSVEKVNGWEDKEFYIADVRYDLEFLTDYQSFMDSLKEETGQSVVSHLFGGLGILALSMKYGQFDKGETVSERAEFRFRDTENGWQLTD